MDGLCRACKTDMHMQQPKHLDHLRTYVHEKYKTPPLAKTGTSDISQHKLYKAFEMSNGSCSAYNGTGGTFLA